MVRLCWHGIRSRDGQQGQRIRARVVGRSGYSLRCDHARPRPRGFFSSTVAVVEHSCAGFIGWLVAFAIFEPYALPRPVTYLDQIELQSRIVRGLFDVPFTRQYVGTTPVLYQIEQFVGWGFGPIAGSALLGAIVLAKQFFAKPSAGKTIILAWLLGYGLIVSLPETKFLRYLAPLIPIFALTAGVAFDAIWSWLRRVGGVRLASVGGVAILAGIALDNGIHVCLR